MKKQKISTIYKFNKNEINIFIGILLGQASMLNVGNKPIFQILYMQKKSNVALIKYIKTHIAHLCLTDKELGLKGHHLLLNNNKWLLTIKHVSFKYLFNMFFYIEKRVIICPRKFKRKVTAKMTKVFTVGEYEKVKYRLYKKIPINLYEYFNAEILAFWFMDESAFYYDSGYGVNGYVFNINTFKRGNYVDYIKESLEVKLKLVAQNICINDVNFIIIKNVNLFNTLIYPYILPEYYKKLHINTFNITILHNIVIEKILGNSYYNAHKEQNQRDLIIGTLLGGCSRFQFKKNSNHCYLVFELPETGKYIIYEYYLIMKPFVCMPIKLKNKKISFKLYPNIKKINSYFRLFYSKNYNYFNKKPKLNLNYLWKEFNARVLVFWFISDGYMFKENYNSSMLLYITNSQKFNLLELEKLKCIVKKKTNIQLNIVEYSTNNNIFSICENSYGLLLEYINKYIKK